jgi:hypothetical protein
MSIPSIKLSTGFPRRTGGRNRIRTAPLSTRRSVCVRPATLLAEFHDIVAQACGRAVSCEFSTSACIDCTDDVENRSDRFWLCNRETSRGTNSCTRTRHRLRIKVSKNAVKFRLAFNQIYLSEPKVQQFKSSTFRNRFQSRCPLRSLFL